MIDYDGPATEADDTAELEQLKAEADEQNRAEIEALMQPGYGR